MSKRKEKPLSRAEAGRRGKARSPWRTRRDIGAPYLEPLPPRPVQEKPSCV